MLKFNQPAEGSVEFCFQWVDTGALTEGVPDFFFFCLFFM